MTVLSNRSNPMDFNYLQRVKVYRLNDGGKWDDKGTGHVSLEYLERSEAVGLVVIDEENNQTLLIHRISADDIYRRQEDTIISWTDPEVATDLALSFQETMSCSYIWDQICSVQRSIQFPSVGGKSEALDPVPRTISDDLEHSGTSQDDDDGFRGGVGEFSGLPPVELSTLPQLVKAVAEVPHFDRDRVAALILREPNYLRKVVDLFKICEDLENLEGLHMLFKIVKGIISLNDGRIFDEIFSEEYIMDIVGALEYDPDLPTKQGHRAFLKDQVIYKEVVPVRDSNILAKIHQTYRIGFIKDVILPRVLDDQTFATFNSIMLFNNVAVVSALQNDSAFISELFLKLWSPNTTERGRRDLILFVQEFCNLSKHLQPGLRNQLLGSLVAEGLFDIVTNTLQSSDESVRLSGSDILVVVSNHSPPLLRAFLVQQQGQILFSVLVKGMLTPGEGGLQSQLLEIMRMLLDSDTMDPAQTDKFLDVFYEKYIDQLVGLLTAGCPPKGNSTEPSKQPMLGGSVLKGEITPEILMSICELMCFCVLHHRFRIKYYVMRNNVVEKILGLTRRKEKYLVVAAVRFLRTCIALKDEFYNRYLVKNNLFQPVIQAFLANGNRYNLLNSAVLELIDFIRKENIILLIAHLVENFSEKLDGLKYVDTFQALKTKYEQSMEAANVNSRDPGVAVTSAGPDHGSLRVRDRLNQVGPSPDLRRRRDERALDKDEEDYFNEDSDEEEDTASAKVSPPSPPPQPAIIGNGSVLVDVPFRGGPFGLVDYEDEEEDGATGLATSKEGSFDRKSAGVLLPALPISDPIWPEMEEVPVKRKVSASLEPQNIVEAAAGKRRKPECDDGNSQSDLVVVRKVEDTPTQAPLIMETEGKVRASDGKSDKEMKELHDEIAGKVEVPDENYDEGTKQPIDEKVEEKLDQKTGPSTSKTAAVSGVVDAIPAEEKPCLEGGRPSDTPPANTSAEAPSVPKGKAVEQNPFFEGGQSSDASRASTPTVSSSGAEGRPSSDTSPGSTPTVSSLEERPGAEGRPSSDASPASKLTYFSWEEKSNAEGGGPPLDTPAAAHSIIDATTSDGERRTDGGQPLGVTTLGVASDTTPATKRTYFSWEGMYDVKGGPSLDSTAGGACSIIDITTTSDGKEHLEGGQSVVTTLGVAVAGGSDSEPPNGLDNRISKRDRDSVSEGTTLDDCNGILEGSERVVSGVKENNAHLVSLGSSEGKLASLGSEILRGGTQPSLDPYTVR